MAMLSLMRWVSVRTLIVACPLLVACGPATLSEEEATAECDALLAEAERGDLRCQERRDFRDDCIVCFTSCEDCAVEFNVCPPLISTCE